MPKKNTTRKPKPTEDRYTVGKIVLLDDNKKKPANDGNSKKSRQIK